MKPFFVKDTKWKVIEGDCLEKRKEFADSSIDAVVTDPPYGLGEVKDIKRLLRSWLAGESGDASVGRGGFMGKSWDKAVTPPNGIVLDPFCGSGTTGIAARLEGFDFVGIERESEHVEIAKKRIEDFMLFERNK